VIAIYAIFLTGTISFLSVLIIPDGKRVITQIVNNGTLTTPAALGGTWWEVDYLRPADSGHAAEWGYLMLRTTDARGREILVKTNHPIVIDRQWQHVERDNGGYRDNLINGLVHYLVGPSWIKIVMECFVVIVGFLILAGAVNTSLVGSNGVLNRLAEDGVLTPWFQRPHNRYGTTNRIINLVGVAQIVVILASLGDVNTLGEAYAFGVVWSFVFMSLSMAVLRFRIRTPRQYTVPLNLNKTTRHGAVKFPIGIVAVFLILFTTACVNLLTKKTATIWGIAFTAFFLLAFVLVERVTRRRHGGNHEHLEQFNEKKSESVSIGTLGLSHPNPILVAARGPRSLPMLDKILHETNTDERDVVVVTCKVLPARTLGVTEKETSIDDVDRELLTRIVSVAEHVGKQVYPVVLPTNNPLYAIATTARDLGATEIALGVSEQMHAETQLEQFAIAWGSATADPQYRQIADQLTVRIIGPQMELKFEMA
jgi:Amino acid permease